MEDDEPRWWYSYAVIHEGAVVMVTNFEGSYAGLKAFIGSASLDGQYREPLVRSTRRWLNAYRSQYESVTGKKTGWNI